MINRKGFSLVEMMVAVGISTFLAVSSALLLTQTISNNKKIDTALNLDRVVRQIRQSTLHVGRNCSDHFTFPSAFAPVGPGPHSAPMRVALPGETLESGTRNLASGYEIVSLDFARAEPRGTDTGGNNLYQGFIELEGRTINSSGTTMPTKKIVIGTMFARFNTSGSFLDCFGAGINADASICTQLNLLYDPTLGSCRFSADMNEFTASSCDANTPISGVALGARLCNRQVSDYCTGDGYMTGFDTGRTICATPPADLVLPPATPPPPVPAPAPTVTPAAAPTPNPAPAPGAEPPPVCAEASAAAQCEEYCLDFGFGSTCTSNCPTPSNSTAPCGTVTADPAPPPLAPPAPPQPDPRPQGTDCSCGGTTISDGQYCGYCYSEYEPEPYVGFGMYRNRLGIVYREESYRCVNGQLIYDPVANPNRGICRGEYEAW